MNKWRLLAAVLLALAAPAAYACWMCGGDCGAQAQPRQVIEPVYNFSP